MDVDMWCLTLFPRRFAAINATEFGRADDGRDVETLLRKRSLDQDYYGYDFPICAAGLPLKLIDHVTDTDIQDASTSVTSITIPESPQTSLLSSADFGTSTLNNDPTRAQSESSAVNLDTTISTLTDVPTTSLDSITGTESVPISSGIGMNEPVGRRVIFQIVAPDNKKRDLNKRATNGFVGNENPNICTFATTFNLAEDQLFNAGVPIFYSGEDFKELSGQGSPSSAAIRTTFGESGQQLVFQNSGLPNGEASFCQNSNGQIYIVFTTGPSSCVPVNLAVYDDVNYVLVEQCQNGRLVGVDDLTSATGITISETTSATGITISETSSPETFSSSIVAFPSTEAVANSATETATSTGGSLNSQSHESIVESTTATEVTTSTEAISGILDTFTSTAQAESISFGSGIASQETPTTFSSGGFDPFTSRSLIVTSQVMLETSTTEAFALPETLYGTSTENSSFISIASTKPPPETSTTEVSALPNTGNVTSTAGGSLSSVVTTGLPEGTSTTGVTPPTTCYYSCVEGESLGSSITTETVSGTSASEVSASSETPTGTTSEEPSPIESTDLSPSASTSVESEGSTTLYSSPSTSETSSEAFTDTTTTGSTEAGTTINLPAPDENSSTEIADIEDTTTASHETPTTTEGDSTVPDPTTAALEETATATTDPCLRLDNPYLAESSDLFDILCSHSFQEVETLFSYSGFSFEACINTCGDDVTCIAVQYSKLPSTCNLLTSAGGANPDEESNIAVRF
ncbi:hypothetical protein NW766_005862 [Fusarium irregulare]|uniref:DUF7908 domain-containing protein n=1 Tax=Fusarium irregulare TaxID=2494466 RepID=A0A9W8PTY6_9HYPO|nr:hypothetical protein NW766_005862 [Fusarium irregulare]